MTWNLLIGFYCPIMKKFMSYLIKTDLPGLTKEDINVNIEDGIMTISGEKKRETEKKTSIIPGMREVMENSVGHFRFQTM